MNKRKPPGTLSAHDEQVGKAPHNGRVEPPVTIRRWRWDADGSFHSAEVFVGGWAVGSYKTERGAVARAEREVAR